MTDVKPQIVDRFAREHTYLRISLTDRCNLRCFYCMPEEGIDHMARADIMSLEEIRAMAEVFVNLGVDTIRLTGGEPLIRKNIEFLIEELAALGVELKLTTNGILLDRYFELFQKVGLKKINISLDTLDKVKSVFITKRDYYDRIMRNVEEAISLGFHIKLNTVLIKGVNDAEIVDFVEFTKDRHVVVKFIEFMPFKGNQWDWSKGVSKETILHTIESQFGAIQALPNPAHSTSFNYRIPGFQGSFGIVSTITNPFCSSCNRLRLTADGKLKTCLFSTTETDLLTPMRQQQAIAPLIMDAIKEKHFSRGGMEAHMDLEQSERNRTMISIGG